MIMAYVNSGRGPRRRGGILRDGMMGHITPRAWRSDGNMFSCLAEPSQDGDVSSCSYMEDDISGKSEPLLIQHQKKRKLNNASGGGSRFMPDGNENDDIETDYLALNELLNDENFTLILNKVCLHENRFRSLTSTLESIVNEHKTVIKMESVVRSRGQNPASRIQIH